jgi:hypothetical protein
LALIWWVHQNCLCLPRALLVTLRKPVKPSSYCVCKGVEHRLQASSYRDGRLSLQGRLLEVSCSIAELLWRRLICWCCCPSAVKPLQRKPFFGSASAQMGVSASG